MGSWFDEFSKALAEGMSRREALKWLGVGIAGALLSPFGMEGAWAKTKKRKCPKNPPACGGQPPCKPAKEGCTCIPRVNGKGFCHNIVYCRDPNVKPCKTDADCAKGWKCSHSCCGKNLCHPNCKINVPPSPDLLRAARERRGLTSIG